MYFDKLMKFFSVLYKSHPWTIMRAKELKSWYDSGAYSKIYNVNERVKTDRKPKTLVNTLLEKEIYCTHCGKLISASAHFCKYCGKENIYKK